MAMLRTSLGFILAASSISAAAPTNRLAFDSLLHGRVEFTGPVGMFSQPPRQALPLEKVAR